MKESSGPGSLPLSDFLMTGAASAAMPVMAYAQANKFAPTTHAATRVYLYFDLTIVWIFTSLFL